MIEIYLQSFHVIGSQGLVSYYPASIRVRTNPSKKVPRITAFCAESLEYLSIFKWPMCLPNIIIVGWWSYNPGAEAMGALGSVPKITFSRVSSHLFSPYLSSSRLSPPYPSVCFASWGAVCILSKSKTSCSHHCLDTLVIGIVVINCGTLFWLW